MIKLVLDTNTLISGFFWEGNEAELIRKIENNKAQLFISNEIIDEVESVIKRPKFRLVLEKTSQTPEQIISKIISLSHFVTGPKVKDTIKDDPSDEKFISCAVNAKADYIISGDNHLLNIKNYNSIKIIRTYEILELI